VNGTIVILEAKVAGSALVRALVADVTIRDGLKYQSNNNNNNNITPVWLIG